MVNYRFGFDELQNKMINSLAEKEGLFYETAAILFSRGVNTSDKIKYFLNPGKHHFVDPFKLSGMSDAVERIKQARDEGETVAVYGDYDADGISATTILYYALKEFGIDVVTVIPERNIGYGLQKEILDKLLDENFPTLLITVDCGISCFNEVEYLKENGVDVIVTDHHELPEVLPECTVVNCKIPSDYGFDSLCGAGVAYKLAYALIGEKANEYLDFAAIATIADSMPLIGENRDIVFEGVNLIKNGKAHAAIKELILVSNMHDISSTGLAFTIAPRINAAGRMCDAHAALKLMTSDSADEIEELAIKLNTYNQQRQTECEKLYRDARQKLIEKAYDKKIIVLADNNWNSGLVGIIAAKLVEEFSRPVILFVNNDGKLHGSARSIENINIFEAISTCKDLLLDFGGHAQAAGISVSEENYDKFVEQIEAFVDKKYDYELFKPKKTVEIEITKPFSLALAKELNSLEPFGTGNKRPMFSVRCTDVDVMPIKQGSPHLSIKTDIIDMLYFNGINMLELINSGTEKEIIFEPNVSIYKSEASLKGYVKGIDYIVKPTERIKLFAYRTSLLTSLNDNDDYLYVSPEMTKKVIKEALSEHYGTIFAVYNFDNLKLYDGLEGLDIAISSTLSRNLVNNIVVGLEACNISGYRKIIYLDRPLGNVPFMETVAETFIDRSVKAFDYSTLNTDKNVFGDIFRKVKASNVRANDSVEFALKEDFGYSKEQIVFTLEVFIELGFFSFKNGSIRPNPEARSSLDISRIYSEVLKVK